MRRRAVIRTPIHICVSSVTITLCCVIEKIILSHIASKIIYITKGLWAEVLGEASIF
jgi:hypothetical protein